jgi:hypothetical protein
MPLFPGDGKMADDDGNPQDDPAAIAYQNRDAGADAKNSAMARAANERFAAISAKGAARQTRYEKLGLAPIPGEDGYVPGP